MRVLSTLGLCVFIFGILVSGLPAQQPGRLRYVNRSDTTCGGQSPCYATIQAAIDASTSGDTIRIQPGTYAEQLTIQKNDFTSASEDDRIIIESDPGAAPGSVALTGSPGPQCTDNFAIRLKRSKFVTIRDLVITGTGSQAISLMGGNNGNQGIHIIGNRIFNNGSNSCDGGIQIARNNPDSVIVSNLIYGNGRNGINFIDADGGPHYVIGNTIYSNGWNGVNVARNHEITLANNIIFQNGTASGTKGGRFGVQREASTTSQPLGITLYFNLICGNSAGQINGPALDATDSGNLTPLGNEGPGVSASATCNAATSVFANINGMDNLPNTADDDFTLVANSPAIDMGIDPRTLGLNITLNPIFEADFLTDATRPRDGDRSGAAQFDIGAHEYVQPNGTPIANAGFDSTVSEGTTTNLDGSASSDPDGDALGFQWNQTAGPTVALSNPSSVNPAFTAPSVTVTTLLTFQLTVSDGLANSSSSVNITVVKANRSPVLEPIGNRTVNVGSALTFSVRATDPDDDPLTYSVSPLPLPTNAGFDASSRVFTFAPTASQVGSFILTFAVSDGRGGSASETITITVANGLSINITSPANGATVAAGQLLVRGTVTNSSGGEIGVTVNGFLAGVQADTFIAAVFVNPDTTTLSATATTISGISVNQTINITVTGSELTAGDLVDSPTGGIAPLTVKFSLRANADVKQVTLDADGDGVVDFAGALLDQQPFTYTQPGVYIATATAIDGQGVQRFSNATIQVRDSLQLDAILQSRWSAMRSALIARDVPQALEQLISVERERYAALFNQLGDLMSILGSDMPTIQPIYLDLARAKYRLRRDQVVSGVVTTLTYYVYFSIDSDGIWRIDSF